MTPVLRAARLYVISEQSIGQSRRVTNLKSTHHSRTVSPLDGDTSQPGVPRAVGRWLGKMCRLVQWEKWGSNIMSSKEGKGEKQVRAMVVGHGRPTESFQASDVLNHFLLPWARSSL